MVFFGKCHREGKTKRFLNLLKKFSGGRPPGQLREDLKLLPFKIKKFFLGSVRQKIKILMKVSLGNFTSERQKSLPPFRAVSHFPVGEVRTTEI
jgi:hypothetical protein